MTVYMITALSADGLTAPADNRDHFTWTSQAHKDWFHRRTREVGVVAMDPLTYGFLGGRPLSDRLTVVMSDADVVTTPQTEERIPEYNGGRETKVVRTEVDPYVVISELVDKNYPEVVIYGHNSTLNSFVEIGLVDILYLTIESKLLGRGTGLFSDTLTRNIRLSSVQQLSSESGLLTYAVD
jgi:dihydrofolate reductase